jgi:hypothetical protein
MRLTRLAVLIGVVVVLMSVSACEASFSTASISEAWMSADEAGDERVTSYAQDATFYAQVDVSNAPDDTALKSSWVAVDVEGADPGLVIDEVEIAVGSGVSFFTLTNDGPWPVGAYKVDIYLNNELAETVEFSVE